MQANSIHKILYDNELKQDKDIIGWIADCYPDLKTELEVVVQYAKCVEILLEQNRQGVRA